MADRAITRLLFEGWRKWVVAGVLLLVVFLAGNALFGKRIRVASIADDLAERPEEAQAELRRLGPDYRDALRDAVLEGDYPLTSRFFLFQVALGKPYYLAEELRTALSSEDETVRRAAVLAYIQWDLPRTQIPTRLPDDVFDALARWCENADSNSPLLGSAFRRLVGYRDDRVPDLLVDLLLERSAGETVGEIGRANDARGVAAEVLADYPDHPGVIPALVEVAKRDPQEEANWVQSRAFEALARIGYDEDPEIYWIAARSDDHVTRQRVARNLENVKDPRVIPVLEHLLADSKEVVRRAALAALTNRRAAVVHEDALYLAEDQFSSIRGDILDAVGFFRLKEYVPFAAWCLTDTDPVVVEKAIGALVKLTGDSWVLTPAMWQDFQLDWQKRHEIVDEVMNDDERKKLAIDRIADEYGRYTDEDRVPHLIRMLAHADRENVKRAMRHLAEITGRTEGFDPAILDPAADEDARSNALHRFVTDEPRREATIADWKAWWETNRKK